MAPAAGHHRPSSVRSRIRRWFAVRPGWHNVADLYDDFPDVDRQHLRTQVKRLADGADGVIRYRPDGLPAKGPGTMYAAPETPTPAREPVTT